MSVVIRERLKYWRRGTGRKGRNNCELDAIYDYTFFVCCVIVPAKLMRFPRVKADGQGFYHCVSRVVEGRFIFLTSVMVQSRRNDLLNSCAAWRLLAAFAF